MPKSLVCAHWRTFLRYHSRPSTKTMSQHCKTRTGSSTATIQARSPHTSSIAQRTSGPSHRRSPTLDVTLCHQQYSPGATHSPTDPTHGTSRLSGTATAQRTDRARASGTVTPRSNPPDLSAPYHLAQPTLQNVSLLSRLCLTMISFYACYHINCLYEQ